MSDASWKEFVRQREAKKQQEKEQRARWYQQDEEEEEEEDTNISNAKQLEEKRRQQELELINRLQVQIMQGQKVILPYDRKRIMQEEEEERKRQEEEKRRQEEQQRESERLQEEAERQRLEEKRLRKEEKRKRKEEEERLLSIVDSNVQESDQYDDYANWTCNLMNRLREVKEEKEYLGFTGPMLRDRKDSQEMQLPSIDAILDQIDTDSRNDAQMPVPLPKPVEAGTKVDAESNLDTQQSEEAIPKFKELMDTIQEQEEAEDVWKSFADLSLVEGEDPSKCSKGASSSATLTVSPAMIERLEEISPERDWSEVLHNVSEATRRISLLPARDVVQAGQERVLLHETDAMAKFEERFRRKELYSEEMNKRIEKVGAIMSLKGMPQVEKISNTGAGSSRATPMQTMQSPLFQRGSQDSGAQPTYSPLFAGRTSEASSSSASTRVAKAPGHPLPLSRRTSAPRSSVDKLID